MVRESIMRRFFLPALLICTLICTLLAACGGGSDAPPQAAPVTMPAAQPGAPAATGNTATDGYNWFNYRRAQLGLGTLARNGRIDAAAQSHSDYQRMNNAIGHEETPGRPGFTGASLLERLRAAGYVLGGSYAAGEVIAATGSAAGFYVAEELIGAIYHRFVIFEPVFRELGTGAATGSTTYFTADFAVVNGSGGLGPGLLVGYPYDQQADVPRAVDTDTESPDPVPGQNAAGYPVSVHADGGRVLTVQGFSVAPRGGSALATRLLSQAAGTSSSASAAAIVPLAPLQAGTTYDVSFSGAVDGVGVRRNWSFRTR
jgi:uncharacterized protein YkwD